MKIAYIILAHKLPEQLVRLVHRLNSPENSFFIHVNLKTPDDIFKSMSQPLASLKNVHFIKRYPSFWGTYGQVEAPLEGIRQALKQYPDFDYIIMLTGQDYPIKSNQYINTFLQQNQGHSYMEYFSLPSEIWQRENGGMDRFNYWHLYIKGRPRKILPRFPSVTRRALGNLHLFGGRTYWCLTNRCARYVDDFVRQNPLFVRFSRHAGLPDEFFFQTILLNSPLKDQIINDNLKYVVWLGLPNPAVLRTMNYENLISSDKLFARKFDSSVDARILDQIDLAIA